MPVTGKIQFPTNVGLFGDHALANPIFLFAKETNQHVVENVIDESHVQDEVVPCVEKVLRGGDVVANDVVSFPSAEERESGPNLELYGIVEIS